jgi:hypothetical protein
MPADVGELSYSRCDALSKGNVGGELMMPQIQGNMFLHRLSIDKGTYGS